MGKRTVVREQERSGRVGIQAPDRDDAALMAHQADDGRPPLRIAGRRHDPSRLVQKDVGERLRLHRAPVQLHAIAPLDEGRQPGDLAVDPDAPGTDQLLGATPRGDSRPREVSV
jgi:hypothetical protein